MPALNRNRIGFKLGGLLVIHMLYFFERTTIICNIFIYFGRENRNVKKKELYEKIIYQLSIYVNDIELKAENNLLDDNVLSEDFIKDLLNVCMGWNLINLNTNTSRFPGIDLGDKERHIGVQVTSTKTSQKILDSLNTIVKNNIDKDFNEIYFFILGKKQKSYSVDFAKYNTLDCSENNIWDVSDIIAWCVHYDAMHMEQVWNVIKREIVIDDVKYNIPIEVKKSILELKNIVHKIFKSSSQLVESHYITEDYLDEAKKSLAELDQIFPYLDECTYFACKKVLEAGIELGTELQTYQKWELRFEAKCNCIRYNYLVEKNLQEASELITNEIPGLQKEIGITIDGDSLFDRLAKLKIDKDILYKQFSVMKFQKVIEDSILRKSKNCIIAFSMDNGHYNEELICRLKSEGTQVLIFENRLQTVEFMYEQVKETFELVLVSSREDTMNKVLPEKEECYLYTVSFENDLPAHFIPVFFSKGNITATELNNCFIYNECKKINIKNITEAVFKDMIANANDCIAHQLRVDRAGNVYISTITGAEEIDGLRFRWESWDSGNEFVGPRAASDYEYVKMSVYFLKKCWENGVRGYCDYYTIFL